MFEMRYPGMGGADVGSHGDGLIDYEETLACANPADGDTDHDGICNDKQMLSHLLTGEHVVSVMAGTASNPKAGAQPGLFTFTTSTDGFGAILASWFAVTNPDLTAIFPNLPRFPHTCLGFLA